MIELRSKFVTIPNFVIKNDLIICDNPNIPPVYRWFGTTKKFIAKQNINEPNIAFVKSIKSQFNNLLILTLSLPNVLHYSTLKIKVNIYLIFLVFWKKKCIIKIGSDKTLDDYINNLMKYPNLKELFNQYGLDLKQFVLLFDKALNMRYKKENIDDIIALENEILLTLRDRLFIPFMNDHKEISDEINNTFNILFQERDLTINEEKTI